MLAFQPPTQITGFSGPRDSLAAIVRAAQGPRGEQSVLVRTALEGIINGLQPKDYLGEIVAARNWAAARVRYVNDPAHVELVKDPQRLVEEVLARGIASGDCDDVACLIGTLGLCLGRDAQVVGVGFGEPGQFSHVFARIMEPKSHTWIVCDPVAGTDEANMLRRVTTFEIWSLDEHPSRGPVESR